MTLRRAVFAATFTVLALLLVRWGSLPAPSPSVDRDSTGTSIAPRSGLDGWAERRTAEASARDESYAGARRPASLRGTEPDGELLIADGRLVISAEVRAFFDYFLAATGELEPTALRALLIAEIEARLPSAAAAEAVALLDRYLDYRRRSRQIAERGDVATDLHDRLAQLRALRREVLGEETAAAFFGEEEAVLDVDLTWRDVLADPELAPEERERLIEAAEQHLPEAVRAARQAARVPLGLLEAERRLRATGSSEDAVRALRLETVGEEATRRLEAMDREDAEWRRRIAQYDERRALILGDPHLSAAARDERIRALREREFSPTERLRVEAHERLRE